MTTAQPGWYPDPEAPGAMRWWDGIQWTAHRSEPYSRDTADLRAPEGTEWNTAWIWLALFSSAPPLLALLAVDWANIITPGDLTGLSMFANVGPAYLVAVLGGWIMYGLAVWFAYLDHRESERRRVPRPFHWAWTFLGSSVYVIGRSVVVRRRVGRGISPMWVEIGLMILALIAAIYVTAMIMVGIAVYVESVVALAA